MRALNGVETYYIYDGEKPILEYGGAYALKAANLYGKAIDEILKRTDYSVTPTLILYYQDDHEGSVTHLTNATGQVIESYRYDAFGKPAIYDSTSQPLNSSTVGNRFLFTGREYAQAFGIYEYRARAYHPTLGRFTSEDPKLFDAGDYNLFRYCGNDPEDRTDPMGLEAIPDALRHIIKQTTNLMFGTKTIWMRGAPLAFAPVRAAQHNEPRSVKVHAQVWADSAVHTENTKTVTKNDGFYGPVQVQAVTRPTVDDKGTVSERGRDRSISVAQRVAVETKFGTSTTKAQRDLEMTNQAAIAKWATGRGTREVQRAVDKMQIRSSMDAERAVYTATVGSLKTFVAERAEQVDTPWGEHRQTP